MNAATTCDAPTQLDPADLELLSSARILKEVIADPALDKDEFKLGDRTFKIVDLGYDEYLTFSSHIEPLLKSAASLVTQRAGVSIPGLESELGSIDAGFLLKFCKKSLPEMAVIVCNMQEIVEAGKEGRAPHARKLVDVAWVKKHGKNPMALAGLVMRQINKNNMIMDFLDFFVQVLPTVLSLSRIKGDGTAAAKA